MTEQWRDVVGYEGRYAVSDLGRVRTTRRERVRGGLLAVQVNMRGYPVVGLWTGNVRNLRLVHHLVLEAFVGPRPPNHEARHFPDATRTNVRLANLAWGTRAENEADKRAQGSVPIGERHGQAKLSLTKLAYARREIGRGRSQRQVAVELGVNQGTLSHALAGKTWRHA